VTDDSAIIAESLDRPDRFGQLYERHHLTVFRYVRSRVGSSADDVVGDTFVEAFRRRSTFDASRGTSTLPWLLGIATNMIDRRRELERRWLRPAPASTVSVDSGDRLDEIDRRLDDQRLAPALAAALAKLRRRDRAALLLHVTADLSIDEVAAALGVPAGTVKSRLHRARRILAAHLEAQR
jgi:RNA polymerase sigma-70 factor (ECF subfamily)